MILDKDGGLENKMVAGAAILTAILFASSGCGPGQNPISNLVKNVQVKTYTQDSDNWAQVQATLNMGNFQMASLTVPIVDPKDTNKVYGRVAIASGLCGTGCTGQTAAISIDLNVTEASLGNTLDPSLPNGTAIPVAGLTGATIIALPLAQNTVTNSKIYFAFGQGVAMLGAALAFSALDPVGNYVPGVNFFQPFMAGPVGLSAGIFTGKTTNTTGIGLFVDLSTLMKPSSSGLVAGGKAFGKSKLSFKMVAPSGMTSYYLGSKLQQLDKGRTRLQLH